MNFRLDEGLLADARAAAAGAGLSLSEVLREALVAFVAERKNVASGVDQGSAVKTTGAGVKTPTVCPSCGSAGKLRFGGRWCDEHGRF